MQQVDPAPAAGQDCPPQPSGFPQQIGCTWSNFDNSLSWTVNRRQAGTQLFYFVNRYHDHLRDAPGVGFNAASGNFEAGDRVIAQVDDGADTDPVDPGFQPVPERSRRRIPDT